MQSAYARGAAWQRDVNRLSGKFGLQLGIQNTRLGLVDERLNLSFYLIDGGPDRFFSFWLQFAQAF